MRLTRTVLLMALLLPACVNRISLEEMERGISQELNGRLERQAVATRVTKVMLVREDSRHLTGIVTFDRQETLKVTVKTDGRSYIWEVPEETLQAILVQRRISDTPVELRDVAVPPSSAESGGNFFQTELHKAALRAASRQTMGNILTIATTLEAYCVDYNTYPAVSSLAQLATLVQPTYVTELPTVDAFNTPFRIEVSADGSAYRLTSAGTDGRFEQLQPLRSVPRRADPAPYDGDTGPFDDPQSDIVYANGAFKRWWRPVSDFPGL